MGRLTDVAARLTVQAVRMGARVIPGPLRKALEDRVFYAIFQVTRVENDAYGWRPPEPERTEES